MFEIALRIAVEMRTRVEHVAVVGLRDRFTDADRERWGNLDVRTCAPTGPPSLGYSADAVEEIIATQPDLIHLHGSWRVIIHSAAVAAARLKVPYVVTAHGMLDAWAVNNAWAKKRLAALLYQRRVLRGAAFLHVNSRAEGDSCADYDVPIRIIPNGVDAPNSRSNLQSKVLLYLGRLHSKKNLHGLIEAWSSVAPADWTLRIAGWDQNGYSRLLEDIVRKYRMANIVLAGPLYGQAKIAAFSQAAGFVLPSFSEGQPMAALEAFAFGLPVLMSSACNLNMFFDIGAAIEIGVDPSDIAVGLRQLFSLTHQERVRMGGVGRDFVVEHFTWPAVSSQLLVEYSSLVGEVCAT